MNRPTVSIRWSHRCTWKEPSDRTSAKLPSEQDLSECARLEDYYVGAADITAHQNPQIIALVA
jgi:hypothetical protein